MESRKSVINKRLETVVQQSSPTSSSPLRRKSVSFQNPPSTVLSVNDDEAERIARRREIFTSTPLSSNITFTNKRHSLGLGFLANIPAPQMVESISQCIKLNAENKINIKNAFSLEMIDFMTYMIKKQDANMSNLQVASTSLDVSTKIYGLRVDGVHTDIFKIAGGLEQAVDDTERNAEDHREDAEDAEANVTVQKKKRKKKAKQKIFNTVEALRGNIEIQKPMSMMIGQGDSQTSDMLYQVTLPHHANSGFYLHLYNDVLVDVVEDKSGSQNSPDTKYSTPIIDDFSNLEICMSYSNFEFLDWSVEDEPEENMAEEAEHNDESNHFHFDLDASVEPDDNSSMPEPMNFFDLKHDNNVQGCYQGVANRRSENVLDVRNVPTSATLPNTSEYSFLQPNMNLHWAGPFHWKFRNFARPSTDTGSKVTHCMQAPLRKRRQIELAYDENSDVIDAKFALSLSNKLQAKTAKTEWNTEDLMLPEDVHYDIAQMMKLYLNPRLILKSQNDEKGNDNNAVTAVDVSDNERYDYNNPNDTLEYCPDTNNGDDYEEGGRDFEDDAIGLGNQNFIGDNLVAAPKLANKISIAYCLKAKKIDMRQLKKTIWKLCTNDNVDLININEEENTHIEANTNMKENKQFSDIYKMLPKLLTKTNVEALSVPIAFISLLHLANEKTLKIHSLPDMSDIIVGAD
ncbi:condensin complex subunit 2-like [Anoplolepis gracilipes]|uniref:condensin complex subunit 2-like n=1 Tax=Anoplolepis gracilipes TaxID=354296 RepID=UPI003BA3A065